MTEWATTAVQLFGLGVAVGLSGPCLFACGPPLLLFITGQRSTSSQVLWHLVAFLSGRLVSYSLLGLAAGVSASWLHGMITPEVAEAARPLGGLLVIGLGTLTWVRRHRHSCSRPPRATGTLGALSLFLLGLTMGLSVCPPLLAVFSEIVFSAKSWWDGLVFGFAFGCGATVSGFAVLGAVSGVAAWLPSRFLQPGSRGTRVFQGVAAGSLILYGLWIVIRSLA
jgi:sulfite exporter TauE/SafE